jgi:CRP/FNR family transcriptional regulator, cyclic AMP receptor protein
MSAGAVPTRSQGRPGKRIPSANLARSAKPTTGEISKPPGRLTPKSQPRNGNMVFDPEIFLARTGFGRQVLNLKKNETAYAQGDAADAIFYVQKGQLRVTVTSANGKEATLALVGAGEFLGEDCMVLAHPLRLATATAMTECALLRISKTEMVRVLHQEPALSDMFVSFLLTRNARVQADLVDQLFNSSEKRLARALLLVARYGNDEKPEKIIARVSQGTLAEMIGTTRGRVSFFMNKFRKLGFIRYNGGLHVNDSLLRVILHD